jgi:hypothetical protein
MSAVTCAARPATLDPSDERAVVAVEAFTAESGPTLVSPLRRRATLFSARRRFTRVRTFARGYLLP